MAKFMKNYIATEKEVIEDYRMSYMSLREYAAYTGVPKSTLWDMLQRDKLAAKKPAKKAKAAPVTEASWTPAEVVEDKPKVNTKKIDKLLNNLFSKLETLDNKLTNLVSNVYNEFYELQDELENNEII